MRVYATIVLANFRGRREAKEKNLAILYQNRLFILKYFYQNRAYPEQRVAHPLAGSQLSLPKLMKSLFALFSQPYPYSS